MSFIGLEADEVHVHTSGHEDEGVKFIKYKNADAQFANHGFSQY